MVWMRERQGKGKREGKWFGCENGWGKGSGRKNGLDARTAGEREAGGKMVWLRERQGKGKQERKVIRCEKGKGMAVGYVICIFVPCEQNFEIKMNIRFYR